MSLEQFLPPILPPEKLVFDDDLSWDNCYTVKSGHFQAIKTFGNTSQGLIQDERRERLE